MNELEILTALEASAKDPVGSYQLLAADTPAHPETYIVATVLARSTTTARELRIEADGSTAVVRWKGNANEYFTGRWSASPLEHCSNAPRLGEYDRWALWPKLIGTMERITVSLAAEGLRLRWVYERGVLQESETMGTPSPGLDLTVQIELRRPAEIPIDDSLENPDHEIRRLLEPQA